MRPGHHRATRDKARDHHRARAAPRARRAAANRQAPVWVAIREQAVIRQQAVIREQAVTRAQAAVRERNNNRVPGPVPGRLSYRSVMRCGVWWSVLLICRTAIRERSILSVSFLVV